MRTFEKVLDTTCRTLELPVRSRTSRTCTLWYHYQPRLRTSDHSLPTPFASMHASAKPTSRRTRGKPNGSRERSTKAATSARERGGKEQDLEGREERDGEPRARQTRARRRRGPPRKRAARRLRAGPRLHLHTHTRNPDGETHAMVRGGTTAATCPPAKKG